MSRSILHLAPVALSAVFALACSDDSNNEPGTGAATTLDAVTIAAPTAAHPGGTMTMGFNGSMMAGMEQYVDLHQGTTTGPQVPMTCTMSPDRVTITCAPNAALTPGGQYTLHMGAGMMGSNGTPVDMSAGMGMGGTWMTSGMMGGHNGAMTGNGWTDTSGHGGMLFTFTAPSTTSATALNSVAFGPATTTHQGGTVTMTFNGSMMAGMEQYVDLHQGTTTGPVVPMTCTMSPDRVTITCAPNAALTPGGQYTLHMGAGMMGSNGTPVDMSAGMGMGGTWMTSGMMGGHNGAMMGSGWTDMAGHGGMVFTFTAS
jgi:hypothetical protein